MAWLGGIPPRITPPAKRSGHVPERQKARVTRATNRSRLRGSEPVAANQPNITQEPVQQFPGMQNDESLDRPRALVEGDESRPEIDRFAVEVLRAFAVFARTPQRRADTARLHEGRRVDDE